MSSKLWHAAAGVAITALLLAAMGPSAARAASPQKPTVSPQGNPSSGLQVSIDPNTGRIRSITPAEARRLVAEMSHLFSRPIAASDVTRHADGTISVDLSGSFQNVYVARINADGTLGQACVDNAAAAYQFFTGGAGVSEEK